jgi:hypothetical protein
MLPAGPVYGLGLAARIAIKSLAELGALADDAKDPPARRGAAAIAGDERRGGAIWQHLLYRDTIQVGMAGDGLSIGPDAQWQLPITRQPPFSLD